jgi:flagellar hook assembly protein FlgD
VIELEAMLSFSPNGDGVKDAAVVRYTLAKKSEVIVKIRRADKARTVVYKERLGKLSSGGHTWRWKGKNLNGKVVRDGRYSAVFVADQVAEGGKTRRRGHPR